MQVLLNFRKVVFWGVNSIPIHQREKCLHERKHKMRFGKVLNEIKKQIKVVRADNFFFPRLILD